MTAANSWRGQDTSDVRDVGGEAIQATNLVMNYGRERAVDGLSLMVPTGSVCGFLGPNGAGKTTTIKTLLGFRRPDGGSGRVLGFDIVRQSAEVRSRVGYVSEVGGLYDHLRVEQVGGFYRSTARRWNQATFERLLGTFGLPRRTRVGGLSKGSKMQLAFALAMGGEPDLLLLDEPTTGLDPVARHELLNILVTQVAAVGKTVFFSSHNLAEVETIADSVVIIRTGRLVLAGDLDDLRQRHKVLKLTYAAPPSAEEVAALRALAGVRRLEQEGHSLRLNVGGDVEAVIRAVRTRAGELRGLDVVDQNLEDLFLSLMREEAR